MLEYIIHVAEPNTPTNRTEQWKATLYKHGDGMPVAMAYGEHGPLDAVSNAAIRASNGEYADQRAQAGKQ